MDDHNGVFPTHKKGFLEMLSEVDTLKVPILLIDAVCGETKLSFLENVQVWLSVFSDMVILLAAVLSDSLVCAPCSSTGVIVYDSHFSA